MPKKDKKPIDLKNYVKQLESSAGKKDKIKELMNNEDMFKKYLINLGMNPEWTELAAVMEIVRNRFAKALKERQRHLRIKENQIILGKNEKGIDFEYNIINSNQFELGSDEVIRHCAETGMIEYVKSTGKSNLEKREIDPETGIVVHHIKRFGGNAVEEADDKCYSLVEYTRDPKEPIIKYRTVYKNIAVKGTKVQENTSEEYDYGYPVEIEKNGTTHRKTPIYFIKRYPKYEEWFYKRFKSRDEYVQNVFSMQKDAIRRIWRDQRKSLETKVITYAKAQDKLDIYYAGLQEIFDTNIIGPVFKLFITSKIESIIVNNEFGMFYETGSGERMLEEIMSRLNEEINPKTLEELIKREGAEVVARIGENEDYQVARETFKGEIKSVEDEDYSIEEALEEIHDKSNIVEGFYDPDNPFSQESNRLDAKISFAENQIKILKSAYKSFPRRRKNIKEAVNDIEKKKVKGIFPKPNSSPGEDGR